MPCHCRIIIIMILCHRINKGFHCIRALGLRTSFPINLAHILPSICKPTKSKTSRGNKLDADKTFVMRSRMWCSIYVATLASEVQQTWPWNFTLLYVFLFCWHLTRFVLCARRNQKKDKAFECKMLNGLCFCSMQVQCMVAESCRIN